MTESRNSAGWRQRAVASRTARVRLSSTDDGNASSSRRVIDASALSAASRIAASASATVDAPLLPVEAQQHRLCRSCRLCRSFTDASSTTRARFPEQTLARPVPPLTRAALDPRRSARSRKNGVAGITGQRVRALGVGIVICVPLALAFANNSPYVMWRTSKRESRSDKPGHSFRNARGGKGAFDAFEAVAARVAVVDQVQFGFFLLFVTRGVSTRYGIHARLRFFRRGRARGHRERGHARRAPTSRPRRGPGSTRQRPRRNW